MYEVQITNRGPEGIRGYSSVRLTQKGSDELQARLEAKQLVGVDLLTGIELEPKEPAVNAPSEVGGPPLDPAAVKSAKK